MLDSGRDSESNRDWPRTLDQSVPLGNLAKSQKYNLKRPPAAARAHIRVQYRFRVRTVVHGKKADRMVATLLVKLVCFAVYGLSSTGKVTVYIPPIISFSCKRQLPPR